ncbi:MAG: LuxR C-terminal-related transcriptional regulator, partial [Stackebrandtia sp.]
MSNFVFSRPPNPLRIVLSAPGILQREGAARILSGRGHRVLAAVREIAELRTELERHRPDIAVISGNDSRDILPAAAEISSGPTAVPVLAVAREPAERQLATLLSHCRGGFGYLVWDRIESVEAFTSAVETVATGGVVTGAAALATVLRLRGCKPLTPREGQVLGLLAHGLSNMAIADELTVTVTSVEKHIKRIMSKLDLKVTARTKRQAIVVIANTGVHFAAKDSSSI